MIPPDQKVKGVKCEVTNCQYHHGNADCFAGSIQIGPHFAATEGETICSTFISND